MNARPVTQLPTEGERGGGPRKGRLLGQNLSKMYSIKKIDFDFAVSVNGNPTTNPLRNRLSETKWLAWESQS